MTIRVSLFIFGAACLTFLSPAEAATTTSLSRGAFNASLALFDTTFEGFDDDAVGRYGIGDGFQVSSFGQDVVVGDKFRTTSGIQSIGSGPERFFRADRSVVFTFAAPITVFAIDINSWAGADGAFRGLLNTFGSDLKRNAVTSVFDAFTGTDKFGKPYTTGQFLGFEAEKPFTQLILTSRQGFTYTLDSVYFGTRAVVTPPPVDPPPVEPPPVAAVPLPAGMPLLLAALSALALVRRRR